MRIHDLDLEAIRQRMDAATPGPWQTGDQDPTYGDVMHPHELIISHQHGMVEFEPSRNGAADAAFTAAARQDVPALLAEVERLRLYEAATAAVVRAARAWRAEASELFGDFTDKLLISAVDDLAAGVTRPYAASEPGGEA